MQDIKEKKQVISFVKKEDRPKEMINIFISHKSEDRAIAEGVMNILKANDNPQNPKITFFISHLIPGGDRWYNTIRRNLRDSNLLLLLFTDATRCWDWCLYEAGLFDRLDDEHHKRVICLHSSKIQKPDPLRELQGFAATKDRMQDFLRQLFVTTDLTSLNEPINPFLDNLQDQIDKQASELSMLIDRGIEKTLWFNNYFFIDVCDPKKLKPDSIPEDAQFGSDQKTLNEVFGMIPNDYSWGEVETVVRMNKDYRWIDELAKAMYDTSNNKIPEPIQAMFAARKGVKLYQPSLYRMDKKADGTLVFKVLLTEDNSWQMNAVPDGVATLITAIVMTTRFRFELLNKYLQGDNKLKINDTLESTCAEIRQIIVNIEQEAESRGLLDQEKLINIFPDKEAKEKIKRMFKEWYEIREKLMDVSKTQDEDSITQYLAQIMALNKEFMRLANYRYSDIMAQ